MIEGMIATEHMCEHWVLVHESPTAHRNVDWTVVVPLQMLVFNQLSSECSFVEKVFPSAESPIP